MGVTSPEMKSQPGFDWKDHLGRVMDAMVDGVVILDPEGHFQYANAAAEELLGLPRAQILGRSPKRLELRILRPDGEPLPSDQLAYAKVLATGSPVHALEEVIERADGRRVAVSAGASPLVGAGGEIEAVVVVLTDVTERRREQHVLHVTQERFRKLAESATDLIFVIDGTGVVDYVNAAAAAAVGLPCERVIGRPAAEVFPAGAFNHQQQSLRQVFETGEPLRAENEIQFPTGAHWVETSLVPLKDDQGEVTAVMGMSRDVTERRRAEDALRESEERYRRLVDASPDAIAVYSEGAFVFANPATVELLGASSEKELIGRPVMDFVHPESMQVVRERMMMIARQRFALPPIEEKLVRLDGKAVCVELAAIPFTFEGKQSVQVLARDITGRKEAEDALRESEERYRLLFDCNPLPMWVYDLENLRFLAVNHAAIEHYGYSRDEFLSMTIKDIRPPEDVPRLLDSVSHVTTGLDLAGMWRHVKKDGTVIDVTVTSYALEFGGRRAELVLANDVTELRRAEHDLKEKDLAIRQAYVDVIGAVTGNRLVLVTPEEISEQLGTTVTEPKTITSYRELSAARADVRHALELDFPNVKSGNEFIVAVCEALTNAVKHSGEATYQVLRRGKSAQVCISDQGPGIDFRNLPRATLAPGFSTQQSLGVGFTLMLDLSDRVLLSTQRGNTTVVLEISR